MIVALGATGGEGVHQAAERCKSSVGLAQRTMYASAALPSFAPLATPDEHPLERSTYDARSLLANLVWKPSPGTLARVNVSLFLIGMGKILFGVFIGAAGVWMGARLLERLLRTGEMDAELEKGNVAAAILAAAGLLSLGLLAQHAVTATFAAVDFLFRGQTISGSALGKLAFYGFVHAALSLAVGAATLAIGTFLFSRLTRGVDEIAQIRKGNVAPAIVLGTVMVVISLVVAPGLETALDGLLPLPTLARDEVVAPS